MNYRTGFYTALGMIFLACVSGAALLGGDENEMWARLTGAEYVPADYALVPEGPVTSVVFIGSSTCSQSTRPEVETAFDQIVEALRRQHRSTASVRTVGVAVEIDPVKGMAYITQIHPFDEIMSGGNWFGHGPRRYIWETHPGEAAVPQVIILSKELSRIPTQIGRDTVLSRHVGVDEIEALAAKLGG